MAFWVTGDKTRNLRRLESKFCRRCKYWRPQPGNIHPGWGTCSIKGGLTSARMTCGRYVSKPGGWRRMRLNKVDLKCLEEAKLKRLARTRLRARTERVKYYVRKDGGVAGLRYRPARKGLMSETMIGGVKLHFEYMIKLMDILFIAEGGYDAWGYKVVTWRGATRYKPRAYIKGISHERWRIFLGNLEARGYVVSPVRSFGRLMR